MKNRIFNTLLMFVLGLVMLQGQSISGEFDKTAIGAEGTSVLTVTANPPSVDQDPGEFQVLIDFPNDGSYIDQNAPTSPISGAGAPSMTWVSIPDGGGSNTWLGTNTNVVLATIGGGAWTLTVEGVGPDSGGNQVITVVSLIYADEDSDGNLLDNPAGLIIDALLPVEFSYFNARNQDCEIVNLAWQTQSEINNDGFFIERSIGSLDRFESLGFVEGRGDSNTEQNYIFTDDANNFNGNVYYRIKQVDVDGRFDYSEIVTLRLDCNQAEFLVVNTYPNPTVNTLYVDFVSGVSSASDILILNSTSQLIEKISRNDKDRVLINMSKYNAGIYYIQIVDSKNNVLHSDKIIRVGN